MGPSRLPVIVLRAVHWFILLNLLVQIGYGAYMTFVVMAPPAAAGRSSEPLRTFRSST